MRTVKQLEAEVVRKKAAWRKALEDPAVSMEDRRKARYVWRKAIGERDRVSMLMLQARSNRRDVGADRRKSAGAAPESDRRKSARGRREG